MGPLLLLAAAAAAAQPADLQTYKDWIVGCDNGRACQAVSLAPEGEYDGYTMVITRGAEADAVPVITISAGEADRFVRAGGKRIPIDAKGAVAANDVPAVLDALRRDPALPALNAAGVETGKVSLAGASAALLYIDDQQKRVGTPSAIVKKGTASAVPPPPALPEIARPAPGAAPARTVPAAQAIKMLGDLGCEAEDGNAGEIEFVRLDPNHTLALTPWPCGNGAYNYMSEALLVDEKGALIRAAFDVPGGMGEGDDTLVNATWNAERGLLESFSKGRGIGDCGVIAAYAWDGKQFRLAEQSVMNECRGSMDYIPVWRAKVTGGG
jgi:hypothetical protein